MNNRGQNSKSEVAKGILYGFLVPFVFYAILLLLNEKLSALLFEQVLEEELILDPKTVAILSICFNLIPFHLFDKKRQAKAMRGIMFSTFILVILWLFIYGKEALTLS